ncbi:MAG TPA: class I SAM-dependent methyltransferase [Phycisphaerae bacterium]|nr:class I SAM-dependent methyltransferase [Phycisphaerae bacterium]
MTDVPSNGLFAARFQTREQVVHYRDRYISGRRVKTHERETAALRKLLSTLPRMSAALDIPSGTGRMFGVLAERCDRVILADSSPAMLDVARDDLAGLSAEVLNTSAERISLPDKSVDLIFCHRLLPHVYSAAARGKMLAEFGRVTRKYVILSFHPPGLRRRLRWTFQSRRNGNTPSDQLRSRRQLAREASAAGLRQVASQRLRRFPAAAFLLFERTDHSKP